MAEPGHGPPWRLGDVLQSEHPALSPACGSATRAGAGALAEDGVVLHGLQLADPDPGTRHLAAQLLQWHQPLPPLSVLEAPRL